MTNNSIETEIKFQVEDLAALAEKIKSVGGVGLHLNSFQRTILKDTPDLQLRGRGVFLRVRDGEKKIMTVKSKVPGSDEKFKERQELEIEVSDVAMAERMLDVLGFTEKWIMEKYRSEYLLEGTVLALDRLPFGNYLEIEGGKDSIDKVVKILELENETRLTSTYWHLFDEYKQANNLAGDNIVFDINRE